MMGLLRFKAQALAENIPLTAHLELTYSCPWDCSFCYNPVRRDGDRLTTEGWISIIDELRSLGTLIVTLTGGDPLAHPAFFDIARAVRRQQMAVRVLTTGGLVDRSTAKALAGLHPLSVELSIHGATASTHDAATRRPGSFTALVNSLSLLGEAGLPVILKLLLTRNNEAELDDVVSLADSSGFQLRIDPVLTPTDDGDCSPLDLASSSHGFERLLTHLDRVGRLPVVARTAGQPTCGVGRMTLAVDPFGEVFPCIQWRHSSLGNVHSIPLGALWRRSGVRSEAAIVADRVSAHILENEPSLVALPFCPAAEILRTGDAMPSNAQHVGWGRASTVLRH